MVTPQAVQRRPSLRVIDTEIGDRHAEISDRHRPKWVIGFVRNG